MQQDNNKKSTIERIQRFSSSINLPCASNTCVAEDELDELFNDFFDLLRTGDKVMTSGGLSDFMFNNLFGRFLIGDNVTSLLGLLLCLFNNRWDRLGIGDIVGTLVGMLLLSVEQGRRFNLGT
jgi:hypothetical protein